MASETCIHFSSMSIKESVTHPPSFRLLTTCKDTIASHSAKFRHN